MRIRRQAFTRFLHHITKRRAATWHSSFGNVNHKSVDGVQQGSGLHGNLSCCCLPCCCKLQACSVYIAAALYCSDFVDNLVQNPVAAESLLWVTRQLWSQPYVAPVYALLLHKWLLNSVATIGSQGPKLLNVLVTGIKVLFLLDVSNGTVRC
jgi:hypothetical protein